MINFKYLSLMTFYIPSSASATFQFCASDYAANRFQPSLLYQTIARAPEKEIHPDSLFIFSTESAVGI